MTEIQTITEHKIRQDQILLTHHHHHHYKKNLCTKIIKRKDNLRLKMNDFPEKRRKRRNEVRVSSEENMGKIMPREVEKQRRQEMASLYASLRSLLPLEFIKGKRSTSDQLNEAVNYIKYLQRNIKDMSSKRDDLMLLSRRRSFESRNAQGMNENSNHVVIRPCLVGVEIVFSVIQKPLSSVLQVLCEHGLCVLVCISSNVNDRFIHTLQAEVRDMALIDFADLKDTLMLTLMK